MCMEKYAKYLRERDNAILVDKPEGFYVYSISDRIIYISEIYILPEHRKGLRLYRWCMEAINIGVAEGCTHVVGSVDIDTNNWQVSEKLMLKYGFTCYRVDGSLKYYSKSI